MHFDNGCRSPLKTATSIHVNLLYYGSNKNRLHVEYSWHIETSFPVLETRICQEYFMNPAPSWQSRTFFKFLNGET